MAVEQGVSGGTSKKTYRCEIALGKGAAQDSSRTARRGLEYPNENG